jgi:hypothetical protein
MWLDQSLKNGWLSALPVADWLREHLIVSCALRNTIFSVWLAYTVVWMAYGLRLISLDAAAGGAGAGGGGAQHRRLARADHPPRHRSAVALRLIRLLAADVPDL